MDLNINKLPERDGPRPDPEIVQMPDAPQRVTIGTTAKIAAFLAIVVTLTGLAINSHHVAPGQSTAASDTPPPGAAASATLPSVAAPTDRTTTGQAPRLPAAPPPTGNSQ
jgi:hypothetical protein